MNYSKVTDNKLDMKSTPGKGIAPRSISKRLAAGLITITVLISIIMIAVIYFNAIREQEAALMKRADEYRDYLVGALELPFWEYDDNTISTIGKTFFQNELVVGIAIKDASGSVLLSTKKMHDLDVINRSGKIYYKGELLGEIEISLTKQYMKEAGRRLLLTYATIILIILITFVALSYFFIHVFLKKPLDSLNRIVGPYAAGIYDEGLKFTERLAGRSFTCQHLNSSC